MDFECYDTWSPCVLHPLFDDSLSVDVDWGDVVSGDSEDGVADPGVLFPESSHMCPANDWIDHAGYYLHQDHGERSECMNFPSCHPWKEEEAEEEAEEHEDEDEEEEGGDCEGGYEGGYEGDDKKDKKDEDVQDEDSFSCKVSTLPSGWKLKLNVSGLLQPSSSEFINHHSICFKSKRSGPGLSKKLVTTSAYIIEVEVGESVDVDALGLRCFLVNGESLSRISCGFSRMESNITRNGKGWTLSFHFKIRVLSYHDNEASYRFALEPEEGDITILSSSFVTRARGCAGIYKRGDASPSPSRTSKQSPSQARDKKQSLKESAKQQEMDWIGGMEDAVLSSARVVDFEEVQMSPIPCDHISCHDGAIYGKDADSCAAIFLAFVKHLTKSEVQSLIESVDRICNSGQESDDVEEYW